jgi:uncharacterized membrane protein YsdA (DUF1294 family)/cold shock CspA family protein
MRFEGQLKSWNDERGFGFIEPLKGGDEIFVHIKSFPAGTGRPSAGLLLTFEVELGPQGKKRAHAVQFVRSTRRGRSPRAETSAPWTVARVLAVPVFIGVYLLVAARWPVSPWVAAFYGIASLVAFVAYAFDKSAARHGGWRTPESTLHGLGLVGGWPGALLAQQLLRHKAFKPSFVAAFWATVCLNMAGFVAAHLAVAKRLLS